MQMISFVIPCYRSEHTLPHVIAEIEEKIKAMGAPKEMNRDDMDDDDDEELDIRLLDIDEDGDEAEEDVLDEE